MKKTNKENPITTFRKANEARKAVVMKSLKKAQDGIETGNDMMINKPGSTGGYKKSISADPYGILNQTNQITPEMANRMHERPRSSRNIQGKGIRQSADTLQKVEKQKKSGSVKKKMQNGGSSEQGTFRSYGAESKSKTSGSTYGYSPQAKRGGIMIKKKK